MASFRIFRLKDHARQSFRSAPHTSGETAVKLKDYVESGSIEADNVYEAWEQMRTSENPLGVGDVLETELGQIRICKYVGFEEAKWILPEPKQAAPAAPVAAPVAEDAPAAGNI